MSFFKEFKEDLSQAVNELMPGAEDGDKETADKETDILVNTFDDEIDVESELSKLDGLLEKVSHNSELLEKGVTDGKETSYANTENQLNSFFHNEKTQTLLADENVKKEDENKKTESDTEKVEEKSNVDVIPKTEELYTAEDNKNTDDAKKVEKFSDLEENPQKAANNFDLKNQKTNEEVKPETSNKNNYEEVKPETSNKNNYKEVKSETSNANNYKEEKQRKQQEKADNKFGFYGKGTHDNAIKDSAVNKAGIINNETQQTKEEVSMNAVGVNKDLEETAGKFEVVHDLEAPASQPEATDETAVITAGTSIKGNINSNGSIDLQGEIEGNLQCNGKLVVTGTVKGNSSSAEFFADSAKIEGEVVSSGTVKIGLGSVVIGNIKATSAVIAGAIKGDIDVKGPVVVDTSAVVMGNIKSRSVQINNGAVIEGFCSQCYAEINMESLFGEKKGKK